MELFLKPEQPTEKKKSSRTEEEFHPRGLKYKIPLTVFFFLLLIGSLIQMKFYISETRERSQLFSVIDQQMSRLTKEMNLGNGSALSSLEKKQLADSLIFKINSYIHLYPDEKEKYAEIWPTAIVYRYLLQWYDHSYFNLNDQRQVNKIDIILEQKISSLDPDLSEILHLLYNLHDFYYFKSLHPQPPESSTEPVREADVQNLLVKSEEINNIFNKQSARLDVNFRTIANMTRIVMNNYYPEIKQWAEFWKGYNLSLGSTNALNVKRNLTDLKFKFPEITFLKRNKSINLSAVRNLSWGIVSGDFETLCTDSKKQFKELLDHIKRNTGYSIILKDYSSFSLLKKDFKSGKLDFCCLSHNRIHHFDMNSPAKPLVLRSHKQQPVTAYYIYGKPLGKSYLNPEMLKGKKLLIDGTLYSDIVFESFQFFDENGIHSNEAFADITIEPQNADLNSLHTNYDFLVTTSEKFDKINHRNRFGTSRSALQIGKSISDVVLANGKNLDSTIFEEITNTLIHIEKENTSEFADFRKWKKFDTELYERYAATERLDHPRPVNLLVINDGFFRNNQPQLTDKFIQSLENYGYSVVKENYYKTFSSNVSFAQVKKVDCHFYTNRNGRVTLRMKIEGKHKPIFSSKKVLTLSTADSTFMRMIEDMSIKTSFQGEVVEINNDMVKIYSPLNEHLSKTSRFELFNYDIRPDTERNQYIISKNHLATGKFTGLSGKMAVLKIDRVGFSNIKTGDYVNVLP